MPPTKEQLREEFETTDIKLTALAKKYDINQNTMKAWKMREGWEKVATDSKKVATKNEKVATKSRELQPDEDADQSERVEQGTPKKDKGQGRRGAPDGNKNAVGNSGGGAPPGNDNATEHGFYRKSKLRDKWEAAKKMDPVDMAWNSLTLTYAVIMDSLDRLFAETDDNIQLVKKKKAQEGVNNPEATVTEIEYEHHTSFHLYERAMNALARQQASLNNQIARFIKIADEKDERRMKLEQMQLDIELTKAEIEKRKGDANDKPTEIVVRRWSRGGGAGS